MAPRTVYVHLGPLKTGTTYVQGVLWGNQALLAERGVCLPLRNFGQQTRAVMGLMGKRMHRDSTTGPAAARAKWRALVEEVQDWQGPSAVVSMEFLCEAKGPAVRRLVADLAPAQVHVVYTARDLVRLVPAMWQTHLRNKMAPGWREYLDSLRDPGDPAELWGKRFWSQQDPAQVLGRWGAHVPPARTHVVTVPPSSAQPDLLWRRFAQAIDVDPGGFDLDVPRANRSLGAVECEALRRINLDVAGRISGPVYADLVKRFVARDVLEHQPNEQPLVLPATDLSWVRERSHAQVATLAAGGYDVVGDLTDLEASDLVPPSPDAPEPDDVDEADVRALLARVAGEVVVEMGRRQGGRRWDGPRSIEQPQPSPRELGLVGVPLRPGGRRHGGAVARRAAGKAKRLVNRIRAR